MCESTCSYRDMLARLVETEPRNDPDRNYPGCCAYCGEQVDQPEYSHAPDCPWRQARELLAGEAVEAG